MRFQALVSAAVAVVALAGAMLPIGAQAQDAAKDYPSKTITLVVPFPPGGGNDAMARIMADRLSAGLGKTVVVENRGAGAGIVGTRSVIKAPADGYTLMLGHTGSIGINPTLYINAGFDPRKDFTPLGLVAQLSLVLLVHPSVKAKDVAELIALAKANPGKFNFASSALGTGSHMCAEMFRHEAGADMNIIPYKGTSQLVTDLVGGHVQASFAAITPSFGNIKAGNVRALAVTSPKRSSLLPDVPTVAESGLSGFDVMLNYGLLAPAGTPKPIVDKIAGEMVKAVKDPKFVALLQENGIDPIAEGPEKFAAMIAAEIPVWAKAVDIAGVKIQQ
jgi:tripartite-type tricarboxylate transporter receptor subunit TctC